MNTTRQIQTVVCDRIKRTEARIDALCRIVTQLHEVSKSLEILSRAELAASEEENES